MPDRFPDPAFDPAENAQAEAERADYVGQHGEDDAPRRDWERDVYAREDAKDRAVEVRRMAPDAPYYSETRAAEQPRARVQRMEMDYRWMEARLRNVEGSEERCRKYYPILAALDFEYELSTRNSDEELRFKHFRRIHVRRVTLDGRGQHPPYANCWPREWPKRAIDLERETWWK